MRIRAANVGKQAIADKNRSAPISRIGPQTKIRSVSAPQPQRSRQLIQQRLRFLQIGGVEPLGEPAVDGGEEVAGLGGLTLGVPQAGEAIAVLRESVGIFDSFVSVSRGLKNKLLNSFDLMKMA